MCGNRGLSHRGSLVLGCQRQGHAMTETKGSVSFANLIVTTPVGRRAIMRPNCQAAAVKGASTLLIADLAGDAWGHGA